LLWWALTYRHYKLIFAAVRPTIQTDKLWQVTCPPLTLKRDETLPNFIKRKHPRKGEKKKQSARTRVRADKRPQRGEAN